MNDLPQSQPARAVRREALIAAAWGFAEATFFFIVPDVFTSRVVLQSSRRGLTACVWAVGGALVGGTLVFALARGGFSPQLAAGFALLPGIHPAMETTAAALLAQHGLGALFLGAASGIPYKLFAVEAARADTPFVTFVLVSAAARLARGSSRSPDWPARSAPRCSASAASALSWPCTPSDGRCSTLAISGPCAAVEVPSCQRSDRAAP